MSSIYERNSGQVFFERRSAPARPTWTTDSQWITKVEHGKWIKPARGSRRLVVLSIMSYVRNAPGDTSSSFAQVPTHLGAMIYEAAKLYSKIDLHLWQTYLETYREETSRDVGDCVDDFRAFISNKSSFPIRTQLTYTVSHTCAWFTDLTFQNTDLDLADHMAIAELPNLVKLEISGEAPPGDKIMRAWSKRMRNDDDDDDDDNKYKSGGTIFPKLRQLFLYSVKPASIDYLSHVSAFPALQVFVYYDSIDPRSNADKGAFVGPWQFQGELFMCLGSELDLKRLLKPCQQHLLQQEKQQQASRKPAMSLHFRKHRMLRTRDELKQQCCWVKRSDLFPERTEEEEQEAELNR